VEILPLGKPLDRQDFQATGLMGQHKASIDGFSVQENCAGSAFSQVAAVSGSCQADVVPKNLEECSVGFHEQVVWIAVDCDFQFFLH
jgi:hypothetical protein